jgi:hypothetical protein
MKNLQKIDVFYFYLLLLVPNLLPTRHIYFKIHTEYINLYSNLNILKMDDGTLNTTEINSDFINYNKITIH